MFQQNNAQKENKISFVYLNTASYSLLQIVGIYDTIIIWYVNDPLPLRKQFWISFEIFYNSLNCWDLTISPRFSLFLVFHHLCFITGYFHQLHLLSIFSTEKVFTVFSLTHFFLTKGRNFHRLLPGWGPHISSFLPKVSRSVDTSNCFIR